MSAEVKNDEKTAIDVLAKRIQAITGSVSGTQIFISLLNDAIELDGEQQEAVVLNADVPDRKLAYLAGRQAAYRDLRRGAIRALELASGQPPNGGLTEPTGGEAL